MLQEYLERSTWRAERGAAGASWYLLYLTCRIRVMFVGAMKFGKAVTIEPDNAATLDT